MHTCTLEDGKRIYHHPTKRHIEIPNLDLLTFLFDSEHSAATDETIVHKEAADDSNALTKCQVRDLTQRIAHGLRDQYEIGANGPNIDTVTVISYGQILISAVFYGIIAAGGVYSAASPSSTVSELARQVKIAKSRVIVCGREHVDVARKAAGECGLSLRNVLVLESAREQWSMRSLEGDVEVMGEEKLGWTPITDPQELKESLIVILWSSGTTGLPKGVQLSHLNLVAETYLTSLNGREWAAQELVQNPSWQPPPYQTLAHLPTSHIAGLFGYLIAPFYAGGTVVWMRKYSFSDLIENLRRYKITAFYTVPSIWLRLSKSAEVKREHFRALEGASTGAAPMDSKLQKSANKISGQSVGQTWGLSETTGAVTAPVKEDPDETGCIGYILPCVELRLVNEEGRDVERGQEGELLVKSPLVTNGYFDNPEATKASFVDGGEWFCTGDIGVERDGKFYVVDRKKELLKYKGLQIAPAEIESLLFTHPRIREAAVVGVPAPDDPGTEWPRAYVVPMEKDKLDAEQVVEFVKARLAPHKQLRGGVVFVDEIPKNAIGKFLRRELREQARREVGRGSKL